jgi:anti-anti-sigma factor
MAYAPENMVTASLHVPHVCVVRLPDAQYGSLDLGRLARVHRLLLDQAEKPNSRFLIVDCSAVHKFGARFAGILVDTWDRLRRCNRQLVLCGLTPYCTKLLQILHLDKLFVLYSTEQVALRETARHVRPGNRAPSSRVWVRKSEVAWDGEMVRLDYIGDDGVPIRSIILPRIDAEGGKDR